MAKQEQTIEEIRVMIQDRKKRNRMIAGAVRIQDGWAFAKYSDEQFALQLVASSKNQFLTWDEKTKMVVQKFEGKTRQQIKEIILNEIKKAGGYEAKK